MKNYEKVKCIGNGSFGQVFLVKDKQTNQEYVIKKINLRDISEKDRKNIENEVNKKKWRNVFLIFQNFKKIQIFWKNRKKGKIFKISKISKKYKIFQKTEKNTKFPKQKFFFIPYLQLSQSHNFNLLPPTSTPSPTSNKPKRWT